MEEPSVLDYLKSKLNPWKYERLDLPAVPPAAEETSPVKSAPAAQTEIPVQPAIAPTAPLVRVEPKRIALPVRSLGSLFFALAAQFALRPTPERDWVFGAALLCIAFILLTWAAFSDEIHLAKTPAELGLSLHHSINPTSLLIGGALALSAFIVFMFPFFLDQQPEFTWLNLIVLSLALFFVGRAFWLPSRSWIDAGRAWMHTLRSLPWRFSIHSRSLIAILAIGLALFVRFYRLGDVPPEMNSDHAEKILDVLRLLSGQTMIFFPSNGGREALQFYLVAGLHRLLALPLNFLTLKIVTASVGFLALPFIYLLGKEIATPRVGWLAFVLAGVAYWPNVVARVGLRLPFYMLFTAALFYFLVRGLRRNSRSDLIFSGALLGLGFYGYSADRILPLLVLAAFGLFLIHRQPAARRKSVLISFAALILVSLVIFIPLFSYIISAPEHFFERMFTRMGDWERPIGDPVFQVFMRNTGKALMMFSWDAGVVWPISIPGFPALGIIAGGLFYMGAGLVIIRYLRQRNWIDLLLLISIPILLLPSILSLAFPEENPNLYRTGGAYVPVFLLGGLALDGLISTIQKKTPGWLGNWLAFGLAGFLLLVHTAQEYTLVFDKYYESYLRSAWNSSEMGEIARDFMAMHQQSANVWVVGFPNWVDTRLVANNAGLPGVDFELKPENIPATQDRSGPKLFMLNPQDGVNLAALQGLYPQGWLQYYKSRVDTKDFMLFYVLQGNVE